jgi:hypothetical protein
VSPDAVFVSFDPDQVCCLRGRQRDDSNLYVPEFPAIWRALGPLVDRPTVLQVSTYDTARGRNPQEAVEDGVRKCRPDGWRGPITVRVDKSMMSLLFWNDAAAGIRLDGLPGRFDDWVAAIDRKS